MIALWMTTSLSSLIITTYSEKIFTVILYFGDFSKSTFFIKVAILLAAFLVLTMIFCGVRLLRRSIIFNLIIVAITSTVAAVAEVWPAPNLFFLHILVGIIACCLLTLGAMRISQMIVDN